MTPTAPRFPPALASALFHAKRARATLAQAQVEALRAGVSLEQRDRIALALQALHSFIQIEEEAARG